MDYIDYRSDNVLELRGPVNRTTGLAVDGATVEALLYDLQKDTYITELTTRISDDEAAAQTVLSVQSSLGFAAADHIHIDLDDGTVHETTGGATTATTMTIAVGLPSVASKGKEIRRYRLNTAAVYISVKDTSAWDLGDVCVIPTDTSGTVSTAEVIQVLDKLLLLDAVVDAATLVGKEVKARLLAATPISCAAYGTFPTTVAATVEGDPAWGYRGDLPSTDFDTWTAGTNIGLTLGQRVRTEFSLVKGTDVLVRNNVATVINP